MRVGLIASAAAHAAPDRLRAPEPGRDAAQARGRRVDRGRPHPDHRVHQYPRGHARQHRGRDRDAVGRRRTTRPPSSRSRPATPRRISRRRRRRRPRRRSPVTNTAPEPVPEPTPEPTADARAGHRAGPGAAATRADPEPEPDPEPPRRSRRPSRRRRRRRSPRRRRSRRRARRPSRRRPEPTPLAGRADGRSASRTAPPPPVPVTRTRVARPEARSEFRASSSRQRQQAAAAARSRTQQAQRSRRHFEHHQQRRLARRRHRRGRRADHRQADRHRGDADAVGDGGAGRADQRLHVGAAGLARGGRHRARCSSASMRGGSVRGRPDHRRAAATARSAPPLRVRRVRAVQQCGPYPVAAGQDVRALFDPREFL